MANKEKNVMEYGAAGKAMYHLVAFVEGYDQQIISVCMRAFEMTLGFSQSNLSLIKTIETMAVLGCSLFWGYLADKFDPNLVLGAGLLIAGFTSVMLGTSSLLPVVLGLRFLHGFGMASINPSTHKVISSQHRVTSTSGAYGGVQAMNCIGRLFSAFLTALVASKLLYGHHGWRTCYVLLGYVWILLGTAVSFFMTGKGIIALPKEKRLWDSFTTVFGMKTSYIIIITLFVSEAPLAAFNYMVLYLQYLGVSDIMAGVACAVTLIGGAVGSVAGGEVIKAIDKVCDKYGMLVSGIVVVCLRLVVCFFFFLGPSPQGKLLWYHYLELALLGASLVSISGVDKPIIKNINDQASQAISAAIVRCIAGVMSSVILYQVAGYLSEKVFGYVKSTQKFAEMDPAFMAKNASALRNSMMYIIVGGTILNIICYVAMCFTYKDEKKS
ncbi:major facilitator superfamily member protein [Babesia caballi]|uniref:Major facilitator superfamily member protein n=1 Tax=Babesia caballi TaxID=5871 RepID=A0AAV4LRT4_BABCB|nr:major facilitator superfamily member protein [Babesia caballi]